MISTTSASTNPVYGLRSSLWSRRITDRRTSSSGLSLLKIPASFPSGVTTQQPELRTGDYLAGMSDSVAGKGGDARLHHLAGGWKG